jgi:hypothetical protein
MDDAMRVRFAAGVRRKNWAFEGWIAGDMADSRTGGGSAPEPGVACRGTGGSTGCGEPSPSTDSQAAMISYGVDVKYLRKVSRRIELYLRGSIGHGHTDGNYSGTGVGIGAGVQLKGKVPAIGFLFWPLFFTGWGPKVTGAVFIDHGVDLYRLQSRDEASSMDARLSHLTIGWAVGSDF